MLSLKDASAITFKDAQRETGLLKMCEANIQPVTETAAAAYGTPLPGSLTCTLHGGKSGWARKGGPEAEGASGDW